MRWSGRVNHQDHRQEGPEKTGLRHNREQRRRRDTQLVMIQCQEVQMIICEQTAMETDVIEQIIVMDSGTARTSENIVMDSGNARESDSIVMGSENARASDGSGDQGVLRMDQEEGISAEEQARRRLRSKQPDRRSDDETVSKRMKRETTIAVIKQKILKNC